MTCSSSSFESAWDGRVKPDHDERGMVGTCQRGMVGTCRNADRRLAGAGGGETGAGSRMAVTDHPSAKSGGGIANALAARRTMLTTWSPAGPSGQARCKEYPPPD